MSVIGVLTAGGDCPGLNAVEHPVYDIWLKDCKMTSDVAPPEDS